MADLNSRAIYEQGALLCTSGRGPQALGEAKGRAQKALELASEALLHQPDDGYLLALLGLALRATGKLADAQEALESAACLIALPPAAACGLGECYLSQSKFELAALVFRHLAGRADLPFDLLAPLARALGRLEQLELALTVCRQAATRAPDADEPLFAMAYFMRRLARPPEVILPVMQQALRLAPDSQTYRLALASLCAEMRDLEAARQVLALIAIENVACVSCLNRMHDLFTRAGDVVRRDQCAERVRSLQSDVLNHTRPHLRPRG